MRTYTLMIACILQSAAPAQASGGGGQCERLYQEAVAHLAAEQYAKMLQLGEDRVRACRGPRSAMPIGFAQVNSVDALLVEDPAERELSRRSALRHLRVAATQGAALPAEWLLTLGEWIVNLQRRGPAVPPSDVDLTPGGVLDIQDTWEPAPVLMPQPPPPRALPRFPGGPVVTGTANPPTTITSIVCWSAATLGASEPGTCGLRVFLHVQTGYRPSSTVPAIVVMVAERSEDFPYRNVRRGPSEPTAAKERFLDRVGGAAHRLAPPHAERPAAVCAGRVRHSSRFQDCQSAFGMPAGADAASATCG